MWGWGQLAAGDRRGWLGPPAQLATIGLLALVAPHAAGTWAGAVFALAALALAAWAWVAVHAWRRAAARRAALGAAPGGGGAAILWLTPLALALGAGYWVLAGSGSDAALALDAYLADWRAGRAGVAAGRFASDTGGAPEVSAAWVRQDEALRNAVVRIGAEEPDARVNLERPLDGLRWIELGATPDGGRVFGLEAARQETVRGNLFGILPTASLRLVPIERLGTVVVVPVAIAAGPLGPARAWRIASVDILGERLGAAP